VSAEEIKGPANVYEIWDDIADAVRGALEPFTSDTLRFFAGNSIAAVNGVVAEQAQEILAEREIDFH